MSSEDSLNKFILETLKSTGVPVNYGWYQESINEINITFFEYSEQGSDYSDDEMISETHYFQIDLWGRTNLEKIKKQVKQLLLQNGFILTDCKDLFETDTKIFHKALRVKIDIDV